MIVVSRLSDHVKAVYKATRFSITKDTWPPEQPKEFTPLVLLHHKDEYTMKDVTTITKSLNIGAVNDIVSATGSNQRKLEPLLHGNEKLGEILKMSKTTTQLSEILAFLEVSNKPQTILVEGAPGIGKTILLKHIAYIWAEQKMLKGYEMVLLIYLRDPTIQKLSTLKELFQYFYKHSMERNDAAICIKHFSSNQGKTIAFLLDGYDELPNELRDRSLIAGILNRQVLPDCTIVVSSRPHASRLLRNQATLRVDILGFTEEQQKHYIEHSLNDKSQITQLATYFEHHVIIRSLCYVPFNIVLILFLYKQGYPLPDNASELYNMFICLTICRNLFKLGIAPEQAITDISSFPEPYGKFLQQLSKLSLHTLNNNQLIFTLDEIKQFCPQVESIPGALNAFGLLQAIEHVSIFQTATTFNFLHLSIQEFFAANHIITLTLEDELTLLEKYFWSDIHSNTFTFYICLTKGQRPAFRKFLTGGDDTITINSEFLCDKLKCLHLYCCFTERSSDHHICREIEKEFADGLLDFHLTRLSCNDIENISVFLSFCSIKQWKTLHLGMSNIQDASLCILHRILHSASITIEELTLFENNLSFSSDGCIADIVIASRVKELDIGCNKTIGRTEQLFPVILSSSSNLQILRIESINLNYEAANMLFTALRKSGTNLKKLFMAKSNITDYECEDIAETLRVNNTLEYLDIQENEISEEASLYLIESLWKNDALKLLRLPFYDRFCRLRCETPFLTSIVNKERKCRGSQAKLFIKFGLEL